MEITNCSPESSMTTGEVVVATASVMFAVEVRALLGCSDLVQTTQALTPFDEPPDLQRPTSRFVVLPSPPPPSQARPSCTPKLIPLRRHRTQPLLNLLRTSLRPQNQRRCSSELGSPVSDRAATHSTQRPAPTSCPSHFAMPHTAIQKHHDS